MQNDSRPARWLVAVAAALVFSAGSPCFAQVRPAGDEPAASQPTLAEPQSGAAIKTPTIAHNTPRIQASLENPGVGYVAVSRAEVLSGPSRDYYATTYLEQGVALQVYHRTDDGWLGIRPPEGSFSWVLARDAYLLPGGKVIEITNENAVSWIGTQFGSAKQFRWQVDLNRGEQLSVLDEASMTDAEGNQALWYKIGPPAGEFRWIHESAVSTEPVAPKQQAAKTIPQKITSQSATPLANANGDEVEEDGNGIELATANADEQDASVTTAAYNDGVFADSLMAGSSIVEGDVSYVEAPVQVFENEHPQDKFYGWHAFEFAEDGLRFTLMERMKGKLPDHDPLEQDPYSLEMPAKKSILPVSNAGAYSGARNGPYADGMRSGRAGGAAGGAGTGFRVDQPWRSPSELRQNRLNGYNGAGILGSNKRRRQSEPGDPSNSFLAEEGRRSARELVGNIRDRVGDLGQSVGGRFGGYDDPTDRSAGRSDGIGDFDRDDSLSSSGLGQNGDRERGFGADRDQSGLEFREPMRRMGDASGGREDSPKIDWYGVKRGERESATDRAATRGIAATEAGYAPSGPSLRGELDAIQVAFGAMVARSPSLWDFKSLMERTKYCIEHGANPIERGQARLLLDRIQEFQQHARRSAFVPGANFRAGVTPANGAGGMSNGGLPTEATPVGSAAPVQTASFLRPSAGSLGTVPADTTAASLAGSQPFDATGWLVRVYGSRADQPDYALTNEGGAVIAYVSAMPGLNLDGYLNQAVGVVGLRGYLPQLQAGHLQAERVSRLR